MTDMNCQNEDRPMRTLGPEPPQELVINFTDALLRRCYESYFTVADGHSEAFNHVRALMAAHELFRMLEGPHSPRVHETIWHLLLPKLRPGLRLWYQRSAVDLGTAESALRGHLNLLAGEQLENKNGATAPPALSD